ncbi:MAG: MBL fold metallo-hydrolase [Eubacteriaceae bacterium]|nr:MBL fold metallo-hydrolase [Eubacteriaceae bacterium]
MRIKVKWMGCASIIIEADGVNLLAVDPFSPIVNPPRNIELEEHQSLQAIFATHGHFDHISGIHGLLASSQAVCYATKAAAKSIKRQFANTDRVREIRPGEIIDLGFATALPYRSPHAKFPLSLGVQTLARAVREKRLKEAFAITRKHLSFPERGEAVAYEFAIGGKRIDVLGSLPKKANNAIRPGADLLVLAYQGYSDNLSPAMALVKQAMPKKVMLSHFDDAFPPISRCVGTKAAIEAISALGIGAIAPKHGEGVYA